MYPHSLVDALRMLAKSKTEGRHWARNGRVNGEPDLISQCEASTGTRSLGACDRYHARAVPARHNGDFSWMGATYNASSVISKHRWEQKQY
jgi:hypothetical protein